jgi:hypothetical protein
MKEDNFIELIDGSPVVQTPIQSDNGPRDKISFRQAIRCWPRITIYSVALTSAIILGGFDISIISSVASLPQFQYADATLTT